MSETINKLILKSKEFIIPSDFQSLTDINQDIYAILKKSHQYSVKSKVNEKTFESFINNWVNKTLPEITLDNISEYEQLSREFDRMTDIIQEFRRNYIKITILNQTNQEMKRKILHKKSKLLQKKLNYTQINKILFKNNEIDSFDDFIIV